MLRFAVCRSISPAANEFMGVVNSHAKHERPIDATAVKVRVLDGQGVNTVWDSYRGGDTFQTSAKQALRLVELGIVEIVH